MNYQIHGIFCLFTVANIIMFAEVELLFLNSIVKFDQIMFSFPAFSQTKVSNGYYTIWHWTGRFAEKTLRQNVSSRLK